MERLQKIGQVEMVPAQQGTAPRIGIGFEKLDRGAFQPEKTYDKVAALGVHWVRIQSGWARTEKEKGVYDFAWLDEIVDNIRSRGWNLGCVCATAILCTRPLRRNISAPLAVPPLKRKKNCRVGAAM